MEAVPADVLAIAAKSENRARLAAALRGIARRVGVAGTLDEVRRAFFLAGGHSAVVLAPDLTPATALAIHRSLRPLDPALRIIVFGSELLRGRDRGDRLLLRIATFMPGTRAAAGALRRCLVEARD